MAGLKIDIGAQNNASNVFKQVENDLDKLSRKAKGAGGGGGGLGGVKGGGFFGNLGEAKNKFLAGDMGGAVASVTKAVGLMGVAIGAAALAIGKMMSASSRVAGGLDDASKSTGFSTFAIQALGDAAARNGMPVDTLKTKLEKFAIIQNGIGDNKSAQEGFKRLGISLEEVAALNPDQLFKRVADGLKKTGDAGAFDMILKKSADMRGIMRELADGDYSGIVSGNVIDKSAIAAVDAFDDRMSDFKNKWDRGMAKMGAGIKSWFVGSEAVDKAVKAREEEMRIEEELGAATRQRQVEEVNKANEILKLKKESAKAEAELQKQALAIGDKQEQIAVEQKQFEKEREGLGRKSGEAVGEAAVSGIKTTKQVYEQAEQSRREAAKQASSQKELQLMGELEELKSAQVRMKEERTPSHFSRTQAAFDEDKKREAEQAKLMTSEEKQRRILAKQGEIEAERARGEAAQKEAGKNAPEFIKAKAAQLGAEGLFDWRGDQTPEQVIGEKVRQAMEPGAIRDDKRKDRADDRAQKRLLALARQADEADRRGATPSARKRAARDAIAANIELQNAQRNIERRKEEIEQAQIDAVKVQKEIRDNTNFLKDAMQIGGE